jgi:hypothetical protein
MAEPLNTTAELSAVVTANLRIREMCNFSIQLTQTWNMEESINPKLGMNIHYQV